MNLWVKTTFFQGGSEVGAGGSESSIDGRSAGRNGRNGRSSRNTTDRNSTVKIVEAVPVQVETVEAVETNSPHTSKKQKMVEYRKN